MLAESWPTETALYYSVNYCTCKLSDAAAKTGATPNHILKKSLNILIFKLLKICCCFYFFTMGTYLC